ncbi:MAG: TIGR02996 domain-containing protein [Planctomycetes bacterium]|nr:TIGR02996 domain-containing protein [Planctomycetota bacterium]
MTSDHDALLRAICENPREDTPRLVFADYLEEHGQAERAAFIRTDIALSLRDEWNADRVRWEGLIPTEISQQPWFAAAYPQPDPQASYSWHGPPLIRRGFRWCATVWNRTPLMFSKEALDLFARHPIEFLFFFDQHPDPPKLVEEPWFSKLTGLGWNAGRCGPRILRPLLKPPPPGLRELDLLSHAVNPDGMRAIGAGLFQNLTRLSLSGTGPRVIAAMLESLEADPASCSLQSLKIGFDSLHGYARALSACLPPSLRILDITGTSLHSAGTQAFVAALRTRELKILKMSANGMGNDGATALFTSPQLAGLKVLDLSYCMIGDEALRTLLENSPLADGLDLLILTSSASADMKQAVKDRMGDRVQM